MANDVRFEIYPSRSRHLLRPVPTWRWRLRASNGEIVATGEPYVRQANAVAAAQLVQEIAPGAAIVIHDHERSPV